MQREESFDSFYRDTRRAVLLQAFALTGDVQAAAAAVRDAYVAAWHHWRKVEPLADRSSWVRPLAWTLAQRRHAGRIWHRNKGLDERQRGVLEALAGLSAVQRRVLLLVELAGLPMADVAREVGVTREVAERHLQSATASTAVHLDAPSAALRGQLLLLEPVLDQVSLPRPSIVRRAGRKRRQVHTALAVVAATVVAVASGAVAYQPAPAGQAQDDLEAVLPGSAPKAAEMLALPSGDDLLDHDQIRRLGDAREWRVRDTHANTSGDGINTICQQERFADPDGLAALVRTFEARGPVERQAVQTVEVSATAAQAEDAYATTLSWYAGCRAARLQLLEAYRVTGIGARADILVMRRWKRPVTTYSVAVARIGSVITSTVGRTTGAKPPPVGEIAQSLADSVAMLCARSGSEGCAKSPRLRVVPPPPSTEARGMLAVVDLPPVGDVRRPWVGTEVDARPNPSLTTCDRASFAAGGARQLRAWTYVVPGARLPSSFGLSETVGRFPDQRRARGLLSDVRSRLARCEDRDLATTVVARDAGRVSRSGAEWVTWVHETEVSERRSVRFRVGFVRVGSNVAQLTFVAGPRDDIDTARFEALLVRAADRLRELG